MSITDEQAAAINDYCSTQERVARRGVRQARQFGHLTTAVAVALTGAAVCQIAVNLDVLVGSTTVMLVLAALLAAIVYGAVETVRVTVRTHRAGVRRAAHAIVGSRRFRQHALAILNDPTLTS